MSKTVPQIGAAGVHNPQRRQEFQALLAQHAPVAAEAERIATVLAIAEHTRDPLRVKQLHIALTQQREISHYAGWTADAAQRTGEIVEAVLARLTPPPRKKRTPRPPKPPEAIPSTFSQSDLFDLHRFPRKPFCTNDLEAGLRIRSLRQALEYRYIQANPPHLRVWAMFDLDRPSSAMAWEDANLPPPTWVSINRQNGHSHQVYGLSAPVLVDHLSARDAPMRYLAAVEGMMRDKLQGDPGYGGLITKNPAHPIWETLRGPRMHYTLSELAEWLPGIEKYRPGQGVKVERLGLGRNVHLFDTLRKWAYKAVRRYWDEAGLNAWNAWMSECNTRALVFNGEMFGGNVLQGREVWHIARSVAKYTYRKTTAEGFSQWQAAQGQKGGVRSGVVRREAIEDKRASARLMAATGMSVREIAKALDVPKSSAHRWTSDVEFPEA